LKELFPGFQPISKSEECARPIDTSREVEDGQGSSKRQGLIMISPRVCMLSKLLSTAALRANNLSMTAEIFLLSSDKQLLRGWYIEPARTALDFETLGYLFWKLSNQLKELGWRCKEAAYEDSHGQADPALFIQSILSVAKLAAGNLEAGKRHLRAVSSANFQSLFMEGALLTT
jgi:hypothetical protein